MLDNREFAESVLKDGIQPEPALHPLLRELIDNKSFCYDKPIEKPESIISIQGNTISTAQNITVFKGATKAGKTGNTSAIIAGMIAAYGEIVDTFGYEVKKNTEGKLLLHVDTEQSDYHFDKLNRNIFKRLGRNSKPSWYQSFCLRKYDIKQRKEALHLILEHYAQQFNGVHCIVIDGIADYLTSPNDEKESYEVVDFFEKIAQKYNCPVITIIHLNPGQQQQGSTKGRGHLDSQLERKAESILLITKDKESEISTVEGLHFRDAGAVPKMMFRYDTEKGYHVSAGFEKIISKFDKEFEELKKLALDLWQDSKAFYSSSELDNMIIECEGIAKRQAAKKKGRMKELNLIDKQPGHNGKFYLCTHVLHM